MITDQHIKNQHPKNKDLYDALGFTMKSYLEYHGYNDTAKIERHKKYPDTAKNKQIEGNVTVRFTITPKGSVYRVEIVKSSGHSILDTAALKAVNDADPFPKPPARLFKRDIPLELTIAFESTCFERKTL